MGETRKVVRPGDRVKVVGEGLECRVEQVAIRHEGVVFYELSYWRGGDQKLLWVHSSEVVPSRDTPGLEIGFHSNG